MKLVLHRAKKALRDERGQVLPITAILMVGLLGMAALTIDLGRSFYTYRELQATTDAAALAGAHALVAATSTVSITGANGTIMHYSAANGGLNARPSLPNVVVTSSLKCLATIQALGQACVGNVPYNAVQVQQTTTIPLYIAGIFGKPTMPMTTVATASVRGGSPRPSNVAILVDTTLSMNTYDADIGCRVTRMQCALNGLQVLLQKLSPCAVSQTTCASAGVITNSFDRVALFTFPSVTTGTAAIDANCTTNIPAPTVQNGYWNDPVIGNYMVPWSSSGATPLPWSGVPTATPYAFPTPGAGSYLPSGSTYQVTSFLSDFRTSDSASALNPYSVLTKAAGANSGCGGMLPTNDDGVYGTYYAGALYAAQSALMAEQSQYPGSDNVIIILSDGDATAGTQPDGSPGPNNGPYPAFAPGVNASGNYPSYVGMCGQAVTAASAATAAGTLVYAVGYGSGPTGCNSDAYGGSNPNINPCDTMAKMASAPQYFYSDYNQSGSNSNCVSPQKVTSLSGIFKAIGDDLTQSRLIPNNTQ